MTDASIRALVVDDEPPARRGIRVRLEQMGGVLVVGECSDGHQAVDAITRLVPDLVFLDVQMPGLSGFDVIDMVGAERMPVVIFVTAYSSHAIRAFEVQALDYVLKPIDTERLIRAVARARYRLGARRDSRLIVRDRGRVVLLDPDAVTRIEADGDYIRVYASGTVYLVRETLRAMQAKLDGARFVRIHRSLIVQLRHVRQLEPQRNAEFIVTLTDGARVRASRRYSRCLHTLVD
jgi:two-component system, LytTR family, response regulator